MFHAAHHNIQRAVSCAYHSIVQYLLKNCDNVTICHAIFILKKVCVRVGVFPALAADCAFYDAYYRIMLRNKK
jgi:hypothetical protein